jgi:Zn-dependent peptidase ImmA (M78 family)
LSLNFGASEEAILRRLLTLGRTTKEYYARRRLIYQARYAHADAIAKQDFDRDGYKRNMPQEVISNYGRYFAYLVLASYHQDRITLSDASNFLGVKAPAVEKVEKKLAARAS